MDTVFQPILDHPIIAFLSIYPLYLLILAAYRLTLDPLSKFPGPRLAAATHLYEFYYDFIRGGKYTWRIQEMHKKYGPIVRISPCEIHILDPDFYDVLYTGSSNPRDKWWFVAGLFGFPTAFIGTVKHDLHRARRAPVNHFFSKRSVLKLEPMVVGMVEKLCARLAEFKGTGQPVSMRNASAALALDVVTQYAFAKSYGALDEPDFAPHWPDAVDAIEKLTYMTVYFPWVPKLMKKIPLWLTQKMDPLMASVIEFQMSLQKQINSILANPDNAKEQFDHPTIFHEFLRNPDLPAADRNATHFLGEAQSIVGAGQVTTAYYLNHTCWYILSNPSVLRALVSELTQAIPPTSTPYHLPPLSTLESLPYLTSCITEGHRLTHGVAHRLPRVSPKTPILFRNYAIPPNTPVSMTHMFTHQNPDIFPDPFAFRPERWLSSSASSITTANDEGNETHNLKKYVTSFGKGTRSCLGLHLAQAEIYFVIAALFRWFEFEVFETKQEDMDIVVDYFVPMPRAGSKGLRVLVK